VVVHLLIDFLPLENYFHSRPSTFRRSQGRCRYFAPERKIAMSYRHTSLRLLILSALCFAQMGHAYAGWWHHHCSSCGTYSTAYYASSAPAAAPVAAPVVAMAPAYYLYAAAPVASAPAQGLVSSLQDIASVVKLIQELRGGLGNVGGGGTGTSGASNGDDAGVSASLGRIEAGQADLRGRLINNAGVLQSIGERLGDTGPIMLKLDSLKVGSPPASGNDTSNTAADANKPNSGDFVTKSELAALRVDITKQLGEITAKLDKLAGEKPLPPPPKPQVK
jgi:hypothetical protein